MVHRTDNTQRSNQPTDLQHSQRSQGSVSTPNVVQDPRTLEQQDSSGLTRSTTRRRRPPASSGLVPRRENTLPPSSSSTAAGRMPATGGDLEMGSGAQAQGALTVATTAAPDVERTGAELTIERLQQVSAAAATIPAAATVMSHKPTTLAGLQADFLAAKNRPVHADVYLQLCQAYRVHDERHVDEGHENVSAKTMTDRMDNDAIRLAGYASGMHRGDMDNLLKASFRSGLPNPISTALPSMLTFGASSFIGTIHGPWAGFGSALAFALAKPFMAGGIQPAIVSLCDSIRGRNAPTVLAKGEVNDEVWLDAAALTLEGMDDRARTAISAFDQAVQAALTATGIANPKDLDTPATLQRFLAEVSDAHMTAMREALDGVQQALENSAPQTQEVLRAFSDAADEEAGNRPSMMDQRETTLKAEFSNLRQAEGNSWQRIPRTLRASGGTLTTALSGLKPDEMPQHINHAVHRPSHLEGLNKYASAAIGTGWAAATSLVQSPMAGLDERNKQEFNVKAAIAFYDAFTPEGKRRYLAGEEMDPARDVDETKLRGIFTSVAEYMVKSTQENLKQRQKVLGAELRDAGHALNALPEDTSGINPPALRNKIDRYKAMTADLAAVTQGIRDGNPNFLSGLPNREVREAFNNCVTSGGKHVFENMTKVKYAKEGELKAQWTQKVSTDVSMFGLAGQFTPSIVNKLAAGICGGAGHVPNAVVGFLGFYNLAASFAGAQTQYAAINAKNNFREGQPKPTGMATFGRGNTAPWTQFRANAHTSSALAGADEVLTSGRRMVNSELAEGLGAEGLRRRGRSQDDTAGEPSTSAPGDNTDAINRA
ncbi:hypothetical protein [Piscinibacter terrae]|uniref:hypothetical protein n=1 Tax=Piscinibacter terrae TaxID=2496871 RepID=UPI0018E0A988|nr:hypothetical protein [Albitalea terrae]